MSVTTQPTTFADLYTLVLNQVRSQTSQASTVSQAKRAVNMGLQDMHLGQDYQFYWAERSATLVLQPPYSTGTVTTTAGSATVTGSGTLWNTAGTYGVNNVVVGSKIKFAGTEVVYRVSAIASDTSLTLSTIFIGAALSGATYSAYQDEYALESDYLRPVDLRFFDDNREVVLVDRRQLRRARPRNSTTGRPRWATQIELGPSASVDMRPRIVVAPPPDAVYVVPYNYITSNLVVSTAGALQTGFSADDDEPIVPLRYRHAIYYYALMLFYEHKDDVRRQEAQQAYKEIMARTLGDVNVGDNRMRIEPSIGHYVQRAEAPYTGRGRGHRRFDSDSNAFDRLE
jgi:hypothetical protein